MTHQNNAVNEEKLVSDTNDAPEASSFSFKAMVWEGVCQHKKLMVSAVVLVAVVFISVGVVMFKSGDTVSPEVPAVPLQNPIRDELGDISAKLANIEQNLSGNQSYVDIQEIRK